MTDDEKVLPPANSEIAPTNRKTLTPAEGEVVPTPPKFGDKSTIKQMQFLEAHGQAFSGPIPPPDMLERYNKVLPTAAERIVAMAEQQAAHRRSIERIVVEGDSQRSRLGLILGFILGLVSLVGSMTLVWIGRDLYGLTMFAAELVAFVGLFIFQTTARKKERLTRSQTRTEQSTPQKD